MNVYRLNSGELRSWRDRAARTELKNSIFNRHGETQIRAPSGRILGVARAPENSGHIPIERSIVRGAHHAVSPAECICREWQKPKDKEREHHPLCVNKQHWEAQQTRSPDVLRERALLVAEPPGEESPITALATPIVTATREPITALPEPAACVCREWSGATPGAHHSLCEFREAWLRAQKAPTPMLVELETGAEVREASTDEVEASRQKAADDGVGAVELSDGKLYYVRTS
ncbi:MAG: hypothetical protein ACOY0T_31090 [Myxococcota bacterium]